MSDQKRGAGAPEGNKNAEKWTLAEAEALLKDCLAVSADKSRDDNDFIGEVAQACDTTIDTLSYLITKFPDLRSLYRKIKRNCEANCFKNGKNGDIVPSLAIMNLKSNHGWTDRVESTNTNHNKNENLSPEEIRKRNEKLDEDY